MRKKVCVLTSVHPPFDVRIFHKECRSLARAGYCVTLIAPIARNSTVDGIEVRAFPQYRSRIERIAKGWPAMYRAAKRENADIYHFHDPELIPIALLLRAQGKAVVYDVHEDLPKTISYKRYIPALLRFPLGLTLKVIEEFASRLLTGVVTATTPIAERFSKVRHRTVVHNYPLLEEFDVPADLSRNESCNYIAYVGARITVARGAFEMVQAMGLLPAQVKLQLKIAGAFDPPGLPEKLSMLPGWKHAQALGVLGRAEVAQLLRRARAGLVLLHPEPNYLNAQPVKLFEYMGAGIPVIASDFPVWRNIIEDAGCGLLVDPLDPAAIARAIDDLWRHPSEALEMGRRGRAAVHAKYNWNREEERLLKFYSEIAGPSAEVVSSQIEARA